MAQSLLYTDGLCKESQHGLKGPTRNSLMIDVRLNRYYGTDEWAVVEVSMASFVSCCIFACEKAS